MLAKDGRSSDGWVSEKHRTPAAVVDYGDLLLTQTYIVRGGYWRDHDLGSDTQTPEDTGLSISTMLGEFNHRVRGLFIRFLADDGHHHPFK